MSALLKIVQGPNAGAEIALPDGVEITVGAADSCDIVLADPTLPSIPLRLSASPDGTVSAVIPPSEDFVALETAHVFLYGSSALAVGPSDSPWPSLVFPSPAPPASSESSPEPSPLPPTPAPAPASPTSPANPGKSESPSRRPRRPRFLRFLLFSLALLLLLLLLALCLFRACSHTRKPQNSPSREALQSQESRKLSAAADRYNLALDESGARPAFTGNFATRAERLEATARLYSSFPGAALDLTDDESLRTAVADSLFTSGETGLSVASLSDRNAVLSGTVDTPAALSAALDALRADVPRLGDIDTSAVSFRTPATLPSPSDAPPADNPAPRNRRASRAAAASSLPVCGILTTPYPCLVLQNGNRVFAGATIGDATVLSISPDSVVLTNANGSFTWKP